MSSGDFAQVKSISKCLLGTEHLLGSAPLLRQHLVKEHSQLQINKSLRDLFRRRLGLVALKVPLKWH